MLYCKHPCIQKHKSGAKENDGKETDVDRIAVGDRDVADTDERMRDQAGV